MEHQPDSNEVQMVLRAFGFAGDLGIAANMPPSTSSAQQQPAANQTTADQALNDLAEQYRALQLQAGRILTLFGSNAPCEVINRHYQAVENYMTAARDVFGQLTRQGFTVVQQLYNLQGQKTGEQKGAEPVRPAYFEPCGTGFSGVGSTQFGRVVVNLGATTDNGLGVLPVIAWIVIVLIAGGTAVAVTYTIVVNNPALPVKQIEAQTVWMDNYLGCVERTMKTAGMTHERADALCRGLTAPPAPPKPIDMNQLLMYGLIGLGIVGAAALVYAAVQRARRAQGMLPAPEPEAAADDFEGFELPALDAPTYVYAPAGALEAAERPAYVRYCPCR
jgi:hypothetical protein